MFTTTNWHASAHPTRTRQVPSQSRAPQVCEHVAAQGFHYDFATGRRCPHCMAHKARGCAVICCAARARRRSFRSNPRGISAQRSRRSAWLARSSCRQRCCQPSSSAAQPTCSAVAERAPAGGRWPHSSDGRGSAIRRRTTGAQSFPLFLNGKPWW